MPCSSPSTRSLARLATPGTSRARLAPRKGVVVELKQDPAAFLFLPSPLSDPAGRSAGDAIRRRWTQCDAPGFLLTLIVGQPHWQWSNHGQPGSSPRKTHQPTLMTPLI
jgi:hypothetical protein